MTKELGLRLRSFEQARKFAALRCRGEPSVPAQLAFVALDRSARKRRGR
jgi:hypothetical protein